MRQILMLLAFVNVISAASAGCPSWTKTHLAYKDSCQNYRFEITGQHDSCIIFNTQIYNAGSNTLYYKTDQRYFSLSFKDTGNFVVKTYIKDTCNRCDTLFYTRIHVNCGSSSGPPSCHLSKVDLSYSDSCYNYTFENGSYIDSCVVYRTYAIRQGSNTIDTIGDSRVFSHTFSSAGNYYIKTVFHDTCHNCDTSIYKFITVSCDSCDWDFAKVAYSDSCRDYTFELGSFHDSCIGYKTYLRASGSNKEIKISDKRVFHYKFAYTGTYFIKTVFYDSCQNCDTSITKEIHVTCGDSCNWDFAEVNYTKKCKDYAFKLGNNHDTCIRYLTYIKPARSGEYKLISDDRIFSYSFSETGTYLLKTVLYNKCHQCDTVLIKELQVGCDTNKCNWDHAGIYYSGKCRDYTFEMGSYIDSCVKYTTLVFRSGTNDVDTIGHSRVFKYTFKHTGLYYIKTLFYNKCTNCDTFMYKTIKVECDTCDWHKAGIYFSDSCRNYTFEMGSYIDTCVEYTTYIKKSGSGEFTKISNHRVFNYTFNANGSYVVKTRFFNKCHNCDTVITREINVKCDTSDHSRCNWDKAEISYSKKCKDYSFEMGSFIDTCILYATIVYRVGNGTIDTASRKRVFNYSFPDTGMYYVSTIFYDRCNQCDTFIYTQIKVECDKTNSISELNDPSLKVYPNPANSYLIVDQSGDIAEVYLWDNLGRLIYQGNTTEKRVPVAHLSNGLYVLKVGYQVRKVEIRR